jgi:hypothetical protein
MCSTASSTDTRNSTKRKHKHVRTEVTEHLPATDNGKWKLKDSSLLSAVHPYFSAVTSEMSRILKVPVVWETPDIITPFMSQNVSYATQLNTAFS